MRYLFIYFLWTAYCILHSWLISTRFTIFISSILKNYYAFYRIFYIIISVLLLIPLINYGNSLNDPVIIFYSPPLEVIRNILTYGSILLFFWAFVFSYDPLSFFGIRQALSFNSNKEKDMGGEIKQKGLLGIIRHPMYLALIIYLWCQTFRTIDIVVNAILTVYVITGTFLEEKKLVLEFGEAYKKYKQQVPMLIPFTKSKQSSGI